MNRRNFIIGLGTAATLSGAASVTGASIQNQVTPQANFQVVAEDRLQIEKNGELSDSTMSSNGNYSTFLNDDTNSASDFAPTAADDNGKFPNMTINNGTNGDLEMALATNTTNGTNAPYNRNGTSAAGGPYPSSTPYDPSDGEGIAPLQIVNPGGQVEISAEYVPGSAVGTDSSNQELLNRVFSFHIQDADNGDTVTKISPDVSEADGSDPITTTNTATLGGGTNEVYFRLNFNDQLANDLADLASTSGALDFGSATQTAVDLLDQVRFGRDA